MTKNFTLEELTHSITAQNRGIDNTPPVMAVASLRALAVSVLQPARDYLKKPITVSSGFRCEKLNKLLGGAKHSQHKNGEAADLVCKNNSALFHYILKNCEFDQLIWEFGNDDQPGWVHVSHTLSANRGEVLKAVKRGKKTVYELF
jgi:zinc D-Ala-D-Ala carboxypeptidase